MVGGMTWDTISGSKSLMEKSAPSSSCSGHAWLTRSLSGAPPAAVPSALSPGLPALSPAKGSSARGRHLSAEGCPSPQCLHPAPGSDTGTQRPWGAPQECLLPAPLSVCQAGLAAARSPTRLLLLSQASAPSHARCQQCPDRAFGRVLSQPRGHCCHIPAPLHWCRERPQVLEGERDPCWTLEGCSGAGRSLGPSLSPLPRGASSPSTERRSHRGSHLPLLMHQPNPGQLRLERR